jgi:hypothetical protein
MFLPIFDILMHNLNMITSQDIISPKIFYMNFVLYFCKSHGMAYNKYNLHCIIPHC